jgi:hypothetical protein
MIAWLPTLGTCTIYNRNHIYSGYKLHFIDSKHEDTTKPSTNYKVANSFVKLVDCLIHLKVVFVIFLVQDRC